MAAGSAPAWAQQSSLFSFNNNLNSAPATPSTTPVPILRYVDNQNIDGSYTYGYEVCIVFIIDMIFYLNLLFIMGQRHVTVNSNVKCDINICLPMQ